MEIYQDPGPDLQSIAAFINQQEVPSRLFITVDPIDASNQKSKNRFTFSEGEVPTQRPQVKVEKIDVASKGDTIPGIICVTNVNIASGTVHVAIHRDAGSTPPVPTQVKLSWDTDPGRVAWSTQLLSSVAESLAQLEKGNPEGFISGYNALSSDLKPKFWAELLIGIAKFESSWNPKEIFHEPPPLSIASVGLLQLSYQDQTTYNLEPISEAAKSLEDPLVNLRCAVKILETLLVRDGVLASSINGKYRGATRYWSVIRAGHKVDQIVALTRKNVPV